MRATMKATAERCMRGAEENAIAFPAILTALKDAGIEGYLVDLRRAAATYYATDGEAVDVATHRTRSPVAAAFDPARIGRAIREAQTSAPGYTYLGFCETVAAAGCAGYIVSIPGARVVYFGRTGETLVEPFPRADELATEKTTGDEGTG